MSWTVPKAVTNEDFLVARLVSLTMHAATANHGSPYLYVSV